MKLDEARRYSVVISDCINLINEGYIVKGKVVIVDILFVNKNHANKLTQ